MVTILFAGMLAIITDSASGQALPVWRTFREHEYFFSYEQQVFRYAASDSCMDEGATLPIVTSEIQQNFLNTFSANQQNYWLDLATPGPCACTGFDCFDYCSRRFKWSDDSEVTYENWGQGQPLINQTCAVFRSVTSDLKFWESADCATAKAFYICMRSRRPLPTSAPATTQLIVNSNAQSGGSSGGLSSGTIAIIVGSVVALVCFGFIVAAFLMREPLTDAYRRRFGPSVMSMDDLDPSDEMVVVKRSRGSRASRISRASRASRISRASRRSRASSFGRHSRYRDSRY